ncbi:DUF58 domain-containing protein [Henriciella aquimarina]|uniref:DUF58 domain-containing protein n=1 Tax=Henriciella aquimarina TaxID=545261 RepID=UPI001F3F7AD6|nr:DUF58 domain-containing protein [Henriciella aquimarina]
MMDAATIRAEAEVLARSLPGVSLNARAADTAHLGAAGRKRAGTGEQFWQYRHYAQEDAAQRVDWRRSARGDELYVRETELETARTVLFWCDPHKGFDWAGEPARLHKADAARIVMLAAGLLLSKAGERIGALGSGRTPGFGKAAGDKLAEDLVSRRGENFPPPPKSQSIFVIASDFYDPVEVWRDRLAPLAAKSKEGVLLAVNDPMEASFPWKGRVRFSRPGGNLFRIFGRAETIREEYLERYQAHFEALETMAAGMGWQLVRHSTGEPLQRAAAAMKQSLELFGARL